MIESLQDAQSQAPSDRVIEFSDNTFLVDAALIGELLHVPVTSVPVLMREGQITSVCERGIGEDEGEFRLTFFCRSRRARLITDLAGRLLRRSAIDFGDRPIPDAQRATG
ncbi:DUF6522 family protein [Bradyrhizobium sp. CCBAU 53338]|uniref:DUF6522 family protein n=1 Tax=Bradyrhizobium sp. CCBAU 53338 TaxID=1325111 RepID=UPI00188A688F|nr:DUF6522 family protein [Bradyrhizobium sp. CCBAU 53338]QOZ55413.1 hypothetical protein XH90_31630 [Bradyrhizobium sp. CCBAU 53338]